MITIDQIQKLDEKVQAVVERMAALKSENTALKGKLDQYQKRIGELEVMIDRFKQDQTQIEEGIVRALEKLDQLEDSVGETSSETPATEESDMGAPVETERDAGGTGPKEVPGEAPQEAGTETPQEAPEDRSSGNDNELDIF